MTTVLLVDDQPIVGAAIRRMLAREKDIEFHYCSEPTQAQAVAAEVKPHVILQDLVMPTMDGMTLLQAFRADSLTAHTPVIVLSSREDPVVLTEAYALGADDYLVKIPDRLRLIERVRQLGQPATASRATPSVEDGTIGQSYAATLVPLQIDTGNVDLSALGLRATPERPYEDLTSQSFLAQSKRAKFMGKVVPVVGGIPLWSKLGQGGMAAVYYGIHPRLQVEVAVKVLLPHLAESQPDLIDRLYREAQIAARIRAPQLVTVMDVNQEANIFYMVMEYVEGESAGRHLREARTRGECGLSERTALDIVLSATEGLAAAHQMGVIHRDIKPDNILVPVDHRSKAARFRQSKLADLGVARMDHGDMGLTQDVCTLGTPGFMAPEQASDAGRVSATADVFSMGATLYNLLTGERPFAGQSPMEVVMATIREPHRPIHQLRNDLSHGVIAVLDRCLAKPPDNRFQDATELSYALQVCHQELGS